MLIQVYGLTFTSLKLCVVYDRNRYAAVRGNLMSVGGVLRNLNALNFICIAKGGICKELCCGESVVASRRVCLVYTIPSISWS